MSVEYSPPQDGEHTVIIANSPGDAQKAPSIDYLVEGIEKRGLGLVVLPQRLSSESVIDTSIPAAIGAIERTAGHHSAPISLLAIGNGAQSIWPILADPPAGLVSSVAINVPATRSLDFRRGRTVASLSLNLESDQTATTSHHLVHESMTSAHTLHQVIVYGGVASDALDESSPNWNEPTSADVAARATDWLQHRNGTTNPNMENPHAH